MGRFEELVRPQILISGVDPEEAFLRGADDQHQDVLAFPALIAKSRLRMAVPGKSAPTVGRQLLLGVQTVHKHDMRMLDMLDGAIVRGDIDRDSIRVFNWQEMDLEEVEGYIPGFDTFLLTPLVGLWESGQLVRTAQGYQARRLIADLYGLPLDVIIGERTE